MDTARLADDIAAIALREGLRVGAAESVTAGSVATALATGREAATWFHGSLVAYTAQTKQEVLHVDPGPVITAACAEQMALGAISLLGLDVAVATTGVGGPDPEEREAPGTVFVAVHAHGKTATHRLDLHEDEPATVVSRATDHALALLLAALRREPVDPG